MPRIAKTALAEQDLEDIWFHIATDDPVAADRTLDILGRKCRVLSVQPYLGRARDELAPDIRSLAVAPYIIFYRPLADGVEIARVLHGARDVDALFHPDEEDANVTTPR